MVGFRFGSKSEEEEAAAELEMQLESERQDFEMRYGQLGSVHENLRQFRIRKGYKKQEMAAIMEITPRTYYIYEKGERAIPSTALVKLAALTRCDLNEILMGRLAPSNEQTTHRTPHGEDYGEHQDLYEEADAEWNRIVEEDFGPLPDN